MRELLALESAEFLFFSRECSHGGFHWLLARDFRRGDATRFRRFPEKLFTWLVRDVTHRELVHVEDDGRLAQRVRASGKTLRLRLAQRDAHLHQVDHVVKVFLLLDGHHHALEVRPAVADHPHCV